jgi:hypothetical protein
LRKNKLGEKEREDNNGARICGEGRDGGKGRKEEGAEERKQGKGRG